MGELRGRPDTPPDEPDQPAPAKADGARTPTAPTDSNADPRAIRDAFRRAEDPAFADTRVQARDITRSSPDTGPANLGPYRPSKDHPAPDPKPDQPDTPTARTLEVEQPSGENPYRRTGADKSKVDEAREAAWGNVDEMCEASHKLGETMDVVLGRQQPTGQHTQDRPHENIGDHISPQGIDGGDFAAAMLATGLALGEGTRLAYRKASELRERWNAGH